MTYCLYHRVLGHPIEDCYVFKDWVQKQYEEGVITLSPKVLVAIPTEHTKVAQVVPTKELFWGQEDCCHVNVESDSSSSKEDLGFPEEEQNLPAVNQMPLRKGKVLPDPRPPSAKEKGKEIEIAEKLPPSPPAPAPAKD